MQYMLMIYNNEADFLSASQAQIGETMAAYGAYTQALQQAGILLASDRLKPVATATVVRIADGKTNVLNGPYADTKEQLGGFYMIDVPDLDAALSWAARCPGASRGAIEVRPVWTM
ncbi:YciI family protein [Oleomonas cavernae]|uniref:YciI family protein n=1 Tax=Oleomonas cavernae TaxID=2320859 RepID=A0A418WAR2_9PROT|nr:YciI family protein [Oleomonas cavernae]RJF87046.1 YciI family protein [Oleomonas cavernae]